MISIEPKWSCFIVSEQQKQKAAYLNAVITNSISDTHMLSDTNSVGLHFDNNNIADVEYKMLDSLFEFPFDFSMSTKSRERSSVLSEALRSIPDAQLLMVKQNHDESCCSLGLTCLEMPTAHMPEKCLVSYSQKDEQTFATPTHLGDFLSKLH